jgi:hypothetical protein
MLGRSVKGRWIESFEVIGIERVDGVCGLVERRVCDEEGL